MIDYGKRILSLEDARKYDKIYSHDFSDIQEFVYDDCLTPWGTSTYETSQIQYLIDCGFMFSTIAGAERDLRAVQTIAEARRMADPLNMKYIGVWQIGLIEGEIQVCPWFGQTSIIFASETNARDCINVIGQDRLREIYEAGRSL